MRLGDRAPKDNPRFVLTNIQRSCARFLANQFRVLLTATAYVLLQELRLQATRTECAQAQVATLRERLLKLGACVERSVRRIVIHLPAECPFRSTFQKIAWAIGGMTT